MQKPKLQTPDHAEREDLGGCDHAELKLDGGRITNQDFIRGYDEPGLHRRKFRERMQSCKGEKRAWAMWQAATMM